MELMERMRALRLGLLFSVLAGLSYAAGNILTIPYIPKIGVLYVTCIRYMVQTLISLPAILARPEVMLEPSRGELLIAASSGVLIGIAAVSSNTAFTIIPVMDATTIFNTNPVVVMIVSALWLKESVDRLDLGLISIILLGIVCICQPTFLFGSLSGSMIISSAEAWQGYLLAFVTSITVGLASCLTRRIRSTNTFVILLMQGLVLSIPIFVIGTILFDGLDDMAPWEWLGLLGGTCISCTARSLITVALQLENASIITTLMTTEIFFSLIFQVTVFHLYPNWIGILGALFVTLGVVVISMKVKILNILRKRENGSLDDKEKAQLIKNDEFVKRSQI